MAAALGAAAGRVVVCEYDRLHAVLAYEFERVTTQVRLVSAGADELGEDVSVFCEDETGLHETRPSLPLEGEWCLPASVISSDRYVTRHGASAFSMPRGSDREAGWGPCVTASDRRGHQIRGDGVVHIDAIQEPARQADKQLTPDTGASWPRDASVAGLVPAAVLALMGSWWRRVAAQATFPFGT